MFLKMQYVCVLTVLELIMQFRASNVANGPLTKHKK